jgi:hypothetical protein
MRVEGPSETGSQNSIQFNIRNTALINYSFTISCCLSSHIALEGSGVTRKDSPTFYYTKIVILLQLEMNQDL